MKHPSSIFFFFSTHPAFYNLTFSNQGSSSRLLKLSVCITSWAKWALKKSLVAKVTLWGNELFSYMIECFSSLVSRALRTEDVLHCTDYKAHRGNVIVSLDYIDELNITVLHIQ